MVDLLLGVLRDNLYVVAFWWVMWDHSGIPAPVVTASMYAATSQVNTWLLVGVINIAMLLSDLVFILAGLLLVQRKRSPWDNSFLTRVERKIAAVGDQVGGSREYLFCLFGKFLPVVGKFLPLYVGFRRESLLRKLLLLLLGNNLYIVFFYVLGLIFGKVLLEYSAVIAGLSIVLFLGIYTLLVHYKRKTA